MTTTLKPRPLEGKDAVWREFATFISLNELVADSARILPSRILRGPDHPEKWFVHVEVGGEEIDAALTVNRWAEAMDTAMHVSKREPIPGVDGWRMYTAAASVAGIRIHVTSDSFKVPA